MTAVCFVNEKTQYMSALAANKFINLNPVPDKIVFVTPNVEQLKFIHKNVLNTNNIPCSYLQDNVVADICQIKQLNDNKLDWLHCQWVKICLDKVITDSIFILVVDSDLIVNRPLRLFDNARMNLFIETEYYDPYFKTINQLLPSCDKFLPHGDSFISEIMMFIPDELKNMRNEMLVNHEQWTNICTKNTPFPSAYAFSEYETVGTWMLNKVPKKINLIRADTYGDNMKFGGRHKLSELLKTNAIIPLRSVHDTDIDWFN
jgi:hypothetical protein